MRKYWILIFLFFGGLVLSGIKPHDYFIWILEVSPAVAGFVILLFTFKKFRFTDLTYWLILVFSYVLFIGAHYFYSQVPLFNRIKEVLHQSRNNYDKLGHFALGFVLAMIIRELLIRKKIFNRKSWLPFFTVCVSVAISALFELSEWFGGIVTGQSSSAFLGTQGYEWDTQSDMFYSLIGAVCMVVFLPKMHDRQIDKSKVQ